MTISETRTEIVPVRTDPAPAVPADPAWIFTAVAGALALVGLTFTDAALGHPVALGFILLGAGVAVVAERAADPRAGLSCAVLAFALGDGFVQSRLGELTWSTALDVPFLLGLLGAAAFGLSLGQVRLARQRRRHLMPVYRFLRDSAVAPVTVKKPQIPAGHRRPRT